LVLELGDWSTSYSAASVVNGTSLNAVRRGLMGPEYSLLGTIVRCPSGLNAVSFHGPSTMPHSGDVAYVLRTLDWAFR
jgi:hypothetical protein